MNRQKPPAASRLTAQLEAAATAATTTAAEARVVQAALAEPHLVAFGTMADLTERAGVGAGTVARLCAKLGLSGFAELQRLAQIELVSTAQAEPSSATDGSSRSAAERINDPNPTDLLDQIAKAEQRNVASTFERLDRPAFAAATAILAKRNRHIVVMGSDATNGIARQFGQELASLRPQVEFLDGNPVTVARRLALGDSTDAVVAIDVRRYDAWLVDTVQRFADTGADVIALTDNPRSKLAAAASVHLSFRCDSPGLFDSFTAALALLNALNAEVATQLKTTAAQRLQQLEKTWKETRALEN